MQIQKVQILVISGRDLGSVQLERCSEQGVRKDVEVVVPLFV